MWEDKDIETALSLPEEGILLLVTVGNDLRGDDGAGPYIAKHLDIRSDRIVLYNAGMHPENSVDAADQVRPAKVVFIDAANWEGKVGEVRLVPEELIPVQTVSTHMFPLSTIGALMRQDGHCEVYYLGIQLASANLGDTMSPAVQSSCDKLIHYLQKSYSAIQ